MKDLSIDLETWSTVDIAKAGHYRYIMDDSFEILLFGVKVDEMPTVVYDLTKDEVPDWLIEALKDPKVTKHAWNASFEINALNKCGYYTPVTQWQDTMIHAAYLGFPLKLETAGKALGIPEDKQKAMTGKALIRYFSKPCKPTKTNGGRTRNLPHHDTAKWKLYIEYNRQDVESEHYIESLLSDLPVPDQVWREWYEDFSINYRGVRVDDQLVDGAMKFDERASQELTERATELTGLDNVKSNTQMLKWLRENYSEDVTSVAKGTVEELLAKEDIPDDVREVLLLRQKMAKSSTAKYDAMRRAECSDGRIRGLLQFYGAAHTGRFAGRLVQMQNLPRNSMSTLNDAREMVRKGEYQKVKAIYGNVPDTLSQLIRTAFIPSEGGKFITSDFSAIEARVIAWLAGEQSVIDSFLQGKDIYCHMASQMFGVPVEKHGVNGDLRQKGKIAILACIAEGQEVLTDQGLVPIEKVTTDMKLWDGESWVTHEGVIYKGVQDVYEYEGLTATKDHIVYEAGQQRPIRFEDASSCGAHLLRTESGGQEIRLGDCDLIRETMERELEPMLRTDEMQRLRKSRMADSGQPNKGHLKRVPKLLAAKADSVMARPQTDRGQTEMSESTRPKLRKLRRPGDTLLLQQRDRSRTVHDTDTRSSEQIYGNRPNKRQRELREGEPPLGDQKTEHVEHQENGSLRMGSKVLAVCKVGGNKKTVTRFDPRRYHQRCGDGGIRETGELARYRGKARVYDIRNAGPNHRFTVSGCLVHNCGYGGSVGAMMKMGALNMGLKEEELPDIVQMYREANPHIVSLWWDLEGAAKAVVQDCNAVGVDVRGLHVRMVEAKSATFMVITLPSGRELFYCNPFLQDGSLLYYGTNQTTRKFEPIETYGGRLVENVVQAIARDCLCVTISRVIKAGYRPVMHIHDEIIIDADKSQKLEDVNAIFAEPIPWAPGLPLKGDGFESQYYMKD